MSVSGPETRIRRHKIIIKNLFVPIQLITWEKAKADLLPRSAGTFHPFQHPENTMRDKSHLDIFLNLNYGAWEANMAN